MSKTGITQLKRRLSGFLVFSLFISLFYVSGVQPVYASEVQNPAEKSDEIIDIGGHWAEKIIKEWVKTGVIEGYPDNTFRPDTPITRAEIAAILNNLMRYQAKSESVFSDLGDQWYTEAILAANASGIILGDDGKARPEDNATREETAVMFSRALDVKDGGVLKFTDSEKISGWAADTISGMAERGYINGFPDGSFNPKADITRAEVIAMISNAVKGFYNKADTYTENINGTAVVNTSGVILKDMTIKGDLILAEGIGSGDVTLDNVNVKGSTIVRGGGENSIIIKNSSRLGTVTVCRTDGRVSVRTQDGAEVEIIIIEDGSDDVIISGEVGKLQIDASDVTVTAKDAVLSNVEVNGKNITLVVDKKSSADTITFNKGASNAAAVINGTVKTLVSEADGLKVKGDGKLETAEIKGNDNRIEVAGAKVIAAAGVTGTFAGNKAVAPGTSAVVQKPSPGGNTSSGASTPTDTTPEPEEPVPYLSSVTISGGNSVEVGNTLQLSVSGLMSNGDDADLTTKAAIEWSIDDVNVATIDNSGLVTAVSTGAAIAIVDVTLDGKTVSDTFDITVTEPATTPYLSSVTISGSSSVEVGSTLQLSVSGLMSNGEDADLTTNAAIEWSIDDVNVAAIDNNGLLTAVSTGAAIAIVDVTLDGKTVSDTFDITVMPPEQIPFQFYEDFEEDTHEVKEWAKNGTYTINYFGTINEKKCTGEKSFKIDITFDTASYVYFEIPINVLADAQYSSLKFNGQILVEGSISAGLGLNTHFPPTRHSGCEPFKRCQSTSDGKWQSITRDDCEVWATVRANAVLEKYLWQGSKDNCGVGVYLDKIGIFIYGSPGKRGVVYVDDLLLEGTVIRDSVYQGIWEAKWASYTDKIKKQVDKWEEEINECEEKHDNKEMDIAIRELYEQEIGNLKNKINIIKSNGYMMSKEDSDLFFTMLPILKDINYSSNLKDMLCFVANPVSTRKVLPDTALPGYIKEIITCSLTPGEYEPASFVLRPARDVVSLNVTSSDLVNTETGDIIPSSDVDLRTVKCWYQGGTAWSDIVYSSNRVLVPELLLHDDKLIRVNNETKTHEFKVAENDGSSRYIPTTVGRAYDGKRWTFSAEEFPIKDSSSLQPVDLMSGENKQFWITVKAPENAAPGTYTGRIHLTSGEEDSGFITVQVNVLPFKLPEPSLEYSIYYRGCLNDSNSATISSESKSELQFRRELEDMIAHGIKNPIIYQSPNNEELFGKVLEIRRELGLTGVPLYYLGISTYPADWSQEQIENFKSRVSDTVDFAKDYGASEVYIYGQDEAQGEALIKQRPAWQAVHEAGGKMFVAGALGKLDSVIDLLDVFNCANKPSQDEAEKWHAAGKKIFVYANPQGGPEDPELFRRNYGLLALKSGYDGAMTYAYQDPCPGNPWDDFEGKGSYRGHMMTYPTVDGVIDTLAIEGFREAVDDVRYTTLLYQKIESAKSSDDPQKRQYADEAEEYMAELDVNGDLNKIREEIICYILKLSE